ncbi:MAG: hypothetical protein LJE59_05860 [Chromatiaceae bacterium]|jgi:TM2 domain-containing membrane protein YozV|nr:hypothetical protein [Chromatiaceae bacterium]
MSQAIKATLLSALVFPGLGHFYLKKHFSGLVLAGIALVSLYLLISAAADTAMQITEQIQHGDVPLDVPALTRMLEQQSSAGETRTGSVASMALLASWLIGMVDAYRVGRAIDRGKAE